MAAVWTGLVTAQTNESSCYRVEDGLVSYHRETFDPQFKRTHTVQRAIPEADAKTFIELKGPPFTCSAKDQNRVYWHSQVIADADPSSFVFFGGGYAKDKHRIYYRGAALQKADLASFEWFNFDSGLDPLVDAKDNSNIYHKGAPLDGLTARPSPAQLRPFDHNFFRDNAGVYRMHWGRQSRDNDLLPLPEADLSTFRLIGREHGSFARDRKRVYVFSPNGRRFRMLEPAEINSFTILNMNYAKASRNAYFQGEPLAGIDLATFEADGPRKAKDKHRSYDARGKASAPSAGHK